MRNINVSGKLAGFGKNYRAAEGDKKSFCVAFINMSLDKKDESTGYMQTTPVKLMCFGFNADKLNQFEVGEMVYVSGKLDMEQDYTNPETGELVKGRLFVMVDQIDNWPANYNSANKAAGNAPAKPAPGKPAKGPAKPAPGRPAMPKPAVN
jgi:hypothetical protein